VKIKALKNTYEEFHEKFRGFTALTEMVGDKIFLAMSNLYFFNLLKGIHEDFSVVFHLVLMSDFVDVFPIKVSCPTQIIIANEPDLNV
jgi:hypothetical protein